MFALFELVARHGDASAVEAKSFAKALRGWSDQWAIFRLAEKLAHAARTRKGPEAQAFAKMHHVVATLAPTERKRRE